MLGKTGAIGGTISLLLGLLLSLTACQRRFPPTVSPPADSPTDRISQQQYQQARSFSEETENPVLAYVPVIPEHRPIVTIRLAMHVFQDEHGEHNFQDTPEHRAILQSFVDHLNRVYSHLAPHQPTVDSVHVPDSRVRFRLEDVFFYQDRRGYDMADSVCGPYYVCGPDLYRTFVINNTRLSTEQKEERLHILMGEHPYEDKRFLAGGSASGLGSKKFILARGYYWYYFHHPHLDWARNHVAGNMAHELGHSLGLTHTFEGGVCNSRGQRVRIPNGSSNNLLDYGSWLSLTPCQIGAIHRTIENNVGQLQDIQLKDYCQADPAAAVTIGPREDVLWASPRRLKGDLIVAGGGKLTVRGRLGMPAGSRIIVRSGGWLVLEGAELSGNCGQPWDRLQAENSGRPFKTFEPDGFPRNHGRVDRL
jgi:hypothetical protein